MAKLNKNDVFSEFEHFLQGKSRNALAGLLIDYIIESNHQSWDGHPARDQTAYAHLFEDMMASWNFSDKPEENFSQDIFTGSHLFEAHKTEDTSDGPEMTKHVKVESVDNRDFRTTWLWLDGSHYVEVDPIDLVENAVENLPEEEQEHYSGLLKNLKDG